MSPGNREAGRPVAGVRSALWAASLNLDASTMDDIDLLVELGRRGSTSATRAAHGRRSAIRQPTRQRPTHPARPQPSIASADKRVSATLVNDGLRFAVRTGSGHDLVVDGAEGDGGPRPIELLLAAQAGCTAMDVISILRKKRQVVERYEVRVSGRQRIERQPHVFERIDIVHVVDGPEIDVEAVRRAVELSATRYCSVAGNLAAGPVEIHACLVRNGGDDSGRFLEVAVTGPDADPGVPEGGRRC